MPEIVYRPANDGDLEALVQLRVTEPGSERHWRTRIAGYIEGTHNPQHALHARTVIVAEDAAQVVGFIAGHLTLRFDCAGELQWLDVTRELRRHGIATALLRELAHWFVGQRATRICVNVAPDNEGAVAFYQRNGARPMNEHWLVWEDIRNGAT